MIDFQHDLHLFLKMKKIGSSKGHRVFLFMGLAYIHSDFAADVFIAYI